MRYVAAAACIFAKRGGKNHRWAFSIQSVLVDELSGKLVVGSARNHKFQLVACGEVLQVLLAKRSAFTRVWTLHVHNLHNLPWDVVEWPLTTGFEQDCI